MMTPDEAREAAHDVFWPILVALLGIITGALGMAMCQ